MDMFARAEPCRNGLSGRLRGYHLDLMKLRTSIVIQLMNRRENLLEWNKTNKLNVHSNCSRPLL